DIIVGSSDPSEDKQSNETKVRSKREFTKDPIYELFQQVFVNDSWNCVFPIKKLYYLARIFPVVDFLYSSKNVTKLSNNKWLLCTRYGGKNKSYQKDGINGIQELEKKKQNRNG
ncbi:7342_t:CDS:1, partial [Gigaspora margarita]